MPNVAVLNMAGENVGNITLSDAIFGIEPNAVVMHAAVVNYLANQRQGTQSTLTRTEVSGGGRKPWRQKGTGHALFGNNRSNNDILCEFHYAYTSSSFATAPLTITNVSALMMS